MTNVMKVHSVKSSAFRKMHYIRIISKFYVRKVSEVRQMQPLKM